MELTTLIYIEQKDAYLMMHRVKKQKDVNKDKWIGIGGHFEEGESPEECAHRETMEETGLTLEDLTFRGLVTFCFEEDEAAINSVKQPICEYMHLFTATCFQGELKECNEGNLEWVPKTEIYNKKMWEGDYIFFDLLNTRKDFFSLKLEYRGERLCRAVVDGKPLELLDVRDEEGNLTGLTRERKLAHRLGTWHATSHVWIMRRRPDGGVDVLLQKRSADKDSFPGCYDISSAGHIPAGGDFLESALRELKEELGLTIPAKELRDLGNLKLYKDEIFHGEKFCDRQISKVYLYVGEIELKDITVQETEIESVIYEDFETVREKIRAKDPNYCIFEEEFEMLRAALWE